MMNICIGILLQMLCSFWGTLMFSVLFNVQRKYYYGCGLAGMCGWMCYYICQNIFSPAMSCFFGTIVIVICSRMLSVRMKCPITVFLISGIFPLVPGAGVYNTAYYLVTGDAALAAAFGIGALKNAFGIVLGIVIVLSVPMGWFIKGARNQRERVTYRRNGK